MPPWPGDGEVRLVAGRWRPVHSNPNPTGPNLTGRYELRDARQTEGHELLELAVQSKAFWGYSEAFLAACRSELTVPFGTAAHSKVLVSGGDLVGITTVSPLIGEEADLAHLFVRPANIGNGCGVILFQAARELALGFGAKSLLIEADPQALSFYRRMGAQQIGERPSGSISGRMLPLLRLLL
ncbi:MAG: GNAT family N-acetyltransferase [Chromatiales bacterium]|nr:GNAT family N-acetyltransferase [Chromatiales bacterium]